MAARVSQRISADHSESQPGPVGLRRASGARGCRAHSMTVEDCRDDGFTAKSGPIRMRWHAGWRFAFAADGTAETVITIPAAPTCIIVPSDVFELDYTPPGHAFKQVPSSLRVEAARVAPDDAAVRRAAHLLNAGHKVAMLVGQGARGCVEELTEVADLLGA